MRRKWIWHFLFWSLYLALEVYTEFYWMKLQYHQPLWSAFSDAFAEELLLVVCLKIPMIYLMLACIKKYGHQGKNRIKLISALTFLILIFTLADYLLLMNFIVPVIYSHLKIVGLGGFGTLINSFMDKIFVGCVAIALNEYDKSGRLKQREQVLLKEKAEAELLFLKSQINPHFLFNTLNNIYALALKKSEHTPEVILKLSKLLRYILYETEAPFIAISQEIEFLKNYLDLQKIRFDSRLSVNFEIETDDAEQNLIPLLFIPIVENAFKHGASQSIAESFIRINLNLNSGNLLFKVENNFEGDNIPSKCGIGLKNLKRQLELSYADYEFSSEAVNHVFTTTLAINLNKTL